MTPPRLHVLVRSPRLGLVKTRLAARLGERAALALYRAFVADTLAAVDACALPAAYWVEPAADLALARDWLGPGRTLLAQPPGDLGHRLRGAFAWSWSQGDDAALAIGSDIPELTPALLRQAAAALRHNSAVLGPSPDGGYWTIGFCAATYRPRIFDAMPWSTPALLERTLAALGDQTPTLLPSLDDIDTPEDLERLARRRPKYATLLTQVQKG